MSKPAGAPIRFRTALEAVGTATILRLPEQASARLPSRGQVAAHATIDGHEVTTVVEPDGAKGHWIKVSAALPQEAGLAAGDVVSVTLQVAADWPEPDVPGDLAEALAAAPARIRDVWADITPMARWEWVRWVNATANPDTRRRRVEVTISKMDHGKRRPCCFDLSACTDPELARNGKLRSAGVASRTSARSG